jgi:hypothetical protein
VLAQKALAAALAGALLLVAPLLLVAALRVAGGRLDVIETSLALGGEVLHLVLVVAASLAAAAWTRSFAQAVTFAIAFSLTSWAIDASEGFAALAWLGDASGWSVERRLAPFGHGVLALGSIGWLASLTLVLFALASIGAGFACARRKVALVALTLIAGLAVMIGLSRTQRGYDWSEQRRASLPPAVVEGLRRIERPIAIEVCLDRDDSRRKQLENDTLAKLLLARPDLELRLPLDHSGGRAERDSAYGRILIHVGDRTVVTRSISRREIVALVFEAAGNSLPDTTQPLYAGYPLVVEGARRRWLGFFAYFVVPLALIGAGLMLSRRRIAR